MPRPICGWLEIIVQPFIEAPFGDSDGTADADTAEQITINQIICAGSADSQNILDFADSVGTLIVGLGGCGCFGLSIHFGNLFFKPIQISSLVNVATGLLRGYILADIIMFLKFVANSADILDKSQLL